MAGRSSPSSESDPGSPPNTNFHTSFSIETLLKRAEPTPRVRWDMLLHRQCVPKQVCPVPPNLTVPRRFLRVTSPVNVSADDEPQLPDSSGCQQSGTSRSPTLEEHASDEADTNPQNRCSASPHPVTGGNDLSTTEEVITYKKKRPRTAFSVPQIRTLEAEFERNRYLTGSKRKELSRELKLSETQIKIWFQNRRTKLKRKNVSEMENWVQQLYSPLGPMAPRPLVIGDHLYLFTTPNPESHTTCSSPSVYHSPFEPWHSGHWSS